MSVLILKKKALEFLKSSNKKKFKFFRSVLPQEPRSSFGSKMGWGNLQNVEQGSPCGDTTRQRGSLSATFFLSARSMEATSSW